MSDNSSTPAATPPPDSSSTPPPSDSSPPPPPSDSSPPPPSDSSPPPPEDSSQSPPPPSSDNSSPPPPSSDGSQSAPPPPSDSGNNSSPPSDNNSSKNDDSPPSEGKDDNGDNKKSPSSHKSDGDTPSPPSDSKDGGSSKGNLLQLPGSKNDSSNEKSLIAGVAAGAGLLLLIVIVFMISCARRKKRKRREHELQFYRDNAPPHMKSYYNNGQSWQNSKPHDLMVKMPPSSGVSSEHGWAAPPPPPPPMMSSSEMSSAGFSGPHQAPLPPPHPGVALGFGQSSFSYEDLATATSGFAQENLLGQGGFGYVHKGVLPNGKEIAVKSLKSNSGQGEREFQAEVDIISRVHHRHLVSLVGWCSTGSQRMLVYEFVPNRTLEYHLHGAGRPTMDWPTRLKIALGSAKGFAYLHEDCHPRIIHRDIKAANILIDNNFEAKVADFGLAKLSSDNYTHVSTRIMGTFGYLAPEYASSGKLTEKSDVYSFGIMLLELITGRRPIDINSDDDDSLVDWARPILSSVQEGGSYEELVDPRLGNNYDPQQMLHMVACAGACIKHSARARPRMSQIVRALEGDVSLEVLNAGSRGSMLSSNGSDYDLKRFGKGSAVSSQEFSSGDEGHSRESNKI